MSTKNKHQLTVTAAKDVTLPPAEAAIERVETEQGVDLFRVHLRSPDGGPLTEQRIRLVHPLQDIHGSWDPGLRNFRGLEVEWGPLLRSRANHIAPVQSFYNLEGRNRLTLACSDARHPLAIRCSVHEHTAELYCDVYVRTVAFPEKAEYEIILRVDTRDVPYYESLRDVSAWWESIPGYEPADVPEAARLPMYSTWYGYHQQLSAQEVERQCALAKEAGCEAVIVDHGWHRNGEISGFSSCGDWEPCPERFPDMRAHVEAVQRLGMRYLLWMAVPYAGNRSQAWKRFEGKLLPEKPDTMMLDPRYPDVRTFLASIYERALRDWGLDGLKLDFIDRLPESVPAHAESKAEGKDETSMTEAVIQLLDDVSDRLRTIRPDVMIEFRQNYIGPLMRKYGNMMRAADCPNDAATNRIRTIDIRLLAGRTAVHADMVMWHPNDSVEHAAMQLVHTLFAVPQLSVRLDAVPSDHVDMVKIWLAFWKEHRDALLDGELMPLYPQLYYPVVHARTERKLVSAVYAAMAVRPERVPEQWIIVNGTLGAEVIADLPTAIGKRHMVVRDCLGRIAANETFDGAAGVRKFAIPPAGWCELKAALL
ncbi:glycoside hydrolase family 36 protein [Paenibacillus ginsengarvi]|uniref:Alpha-galactosidase n=1 Tax=Paenibacillus ginsengarvi TaxID=400777 RepID=A0A3B0CFR4_9BACL|nr:glycoside hydrolase family 36 protein [Paenibacillus ginsengarvi]RKN83758.1 alpha-galactosidase [Paenibacillus ginsengarvi]